jgi:hypothetical protein
MSSLPAKPEAAHLGLTNPCRVPSCPLNEAGLHHNVGIYKHNGQTQTRKFISVLFGYIPPFLAQNLILTME